MVPDQRINPVHRDVSPAENHPVHIVGPVAGHLIFCGSIVVLSCRRRPRRCISIHKIQFLWEGGEGSRGVFASRRLAGFGEYRVCSYRARVQGTDGPVTIYAVERIVPRSAFDAAAVSLPEQR
jgi:hypothetical protein